MPGCVKVSFAGTPAEAQAFAAAHPGLAAPRSHQRAGDDGLPMLTARFRNGAEHGRITALLASLGWDREFQCETRYGRYCPQ